MATITSTTPARTDRLNGVPVSQCLDLVEAVRSNRDAGQTRWRASTTWTGGFACQSRIRTHALSLDEPELLGGTDTAPNPVEAVLAAYGSCLAVGYTLNAAVRGIQVRSLTIDVEGHIDLAGFFGLDAAVPAGFSSISAAVQLDADATDAQLQDLHRHVLATSPVGSILQRPLDVRTELVRPTT